MACLRDWLKHRQAGSDLVARVKATARNAMLQLVLSLIRHLAYRLYRYIERKISPIYLYSNISMKISVHWMFSLKQLRMDILCVFMHMFPPIYTFLLHNSWEKNLNTIIFSFKWNVIQLCFSMCLYIWYVYNLDQICFNSKLNKAVVPSPFNMIICQIYVFITIYAKTATFLNVLPTN